MKITAFVPLAFCVGLVTLFFFGLYNDPRKLPSPYIGKSAPSFDLEALHDANARVRLADFIGRPFALNVWGTWCPGCRQEHGVLLQIARDGLLPLVGINWRDDRQKALGYLQQSGDPFVAIGYDPNGVAAIDWGVYGAPETFLVDAQGTVVYKHIGPLDWATWEREFLARIN